MVSYVEQAIIELHQILYIVQDSSKWEHNGYLNISDIHDYDWIVESTRDFADTTYGQDLKSRRGAPDSAEWQRSSIINIRYSVVNSYLFF